MAASLTITFDENKYQLMLQEKQNKSAPKRLVSCRSVISSSQEQNTGSTSTPRSIVFGSLGPFPLPAEETTPAKKQRTAHERVIAVTPRATAKKPEVRGNPTRPQPAKNQVCPKTWSPRPSPRQRRSQKSAKPAYLAPLKENQFYPLSHMKEENLPSTKNKPPSTNLPIPIGPGSSHASSGLSENLSRPASQQLGPSSQQGPSLLNSKPRSDRPKTVSRSCPCQTTRKTSSDAVHKGLRPSSPEHNPS